MANRSEFVQAIRDFKRQHEGKLKDLLNQKSNPETVKAFWSDPVIQNYLARPSVTFVDKHPQLHDSTTKEEHDTTDHYELKIYKYLPNAVVYRDETINSSKFYTSLTRGHYDLFSKLLMSFSQGTDDIEVGSPCDIYEIRDRIGRHFLTAPGAIPPRFLINANWKDQHASTCITIFDSVTCRPLITLFMNSFQRRDYYEYSKERFLTESSLSFEDYPEYVNKHAKSIITKTFSIDLDDSSLATQPPSLLINQKNGVAFTINYLHSHYDSGAYKEIEHSPEIETIYSFRMLNYMSPPVSVLRMKYTPKTPFIDVSHHLQQDADDLNCALYNMNFIQAVVDMLKQPEVADRVVKLARVIKSNSSALEALVHIFQEDLKAYLPCYYDIATRAPKSHDELEIFHLNQRWEIGGKSVSRLHPFEPPVSAGSSHVTTNNNQITEGRPLFFFQKHKTICEEKIAEIGQPVDSTITQGIN